MEARVHLNGLNGLRAIAAVIVVLSHTSLWDSDPSHLFPASLGEYAVTIFFTLSGFLITYLLLSEKKKGGINVKKFYIRRMLRIWPLYFAYLLATIVIIYSADLASIWGPLPWYLFFAANIPSVLNSPIYYLAHYWTLGTEEQFYIFWPWIIKSARNTLRALVIFTLSFFALKLFFRFIYFEWNNIVPLHILSIFRFECMSMGGIAAALCIQGNKRFMKIATHPVTGIVCWLALGAILINKFFITHLINQDIAALVTVGLIMNLSFSKRPAIDLENRFFDLLGKLSYGMYIIHPMVIFFFRPFVQQLKTSDLIKNIIVYTGTIMITIAVAWLSYVFFEKRFLKLKGRFSTVKSQDSKYSPL